MAPAIARVIAAHPLTFLKFLSSLVGERIMSTGEAIIGVSRLGQSVTMKN